ncbi:MAG: YbhB/YbcL family Raf kinase inhibitor-like protein [Methanoregulaceae archaeon]|nr:YbhB/YbcL family Raf kinase inhibitor-like protein [Methanoregulaceae archaeon]
MEQLHVTTSVFPAGGNIPQQFTCDGKNISPPLAWSPAPPGAGSFAVLLDDPDSPGGTFTHWVIFNIPPGNAGVPEGLPGVPSLGDGSLQGTNSFGRTGYSGPCPPRGSPHRYFFKVYCLDRMLMLKPLIRKEALVSAMDGHILAAGEVTGRYSRR